MNTSKTVLAARAIAGIFLKQHFLKSMLTLVIVIFASFVASIYVALHSTTWWLLLSIIIALPLFISCLLLLATFVFMQRILPRKLSRTEEKQIKKFVDQFVIALGAKSAQRTPFGLGSYILWSYIKSGNNRNISHAITSPIRDIEELRKQFQDIADLF